jgi:hypothetical protein
MTVIIRRVVAQPATIATANLRRYYDGATIPATLPESYRMSNRCENCMAYKAETKLCLTYNDAVRPEYVCATWKAVSV